MLHGEVAAMRTQSEVRLPSSAVRMQLRPLVLGGRAFPSSAPVGSHPRGDEPRRDYVEIARVLEADLVEYGSHVPSAVGRVVSRIEDRLRLNLREALAAVAAAKRCGAFLSTSERSAIPLAALLASSRRRVPHVAIAHKLSSGLKTALPRFWPWQRQLSHLICLCRSQAEYAVERLGLPRERVEWIHDHVDAEFYRPLALPEEDYILAVGQEQRDYATLRRAIEGTGIQVRIAASSQTPPLGPGAELDGVSVLPWVPYAALREIYARARLVVVPLYDVDYAAGVNGVLEALAMKKALIATRTIGLRDYVADGETALLVAPGDPRDLRNAILSLWHDDERRARLGARGRALVERQMTVDLYVQRVSDAVRRVARQR